jgi:hypothetical protein
MITFQKVRVMVVVADGKIPRNKISNSSSSSGNTGDQASSTSRSSSSSNPSPKKRKKNLNLGPLIIVRKYDQCHLKRVFNQ